MVSSPPEGIGIPGNLRRFKASSAPNVVHIYIYLYTYTYACTFML